MAFCGTTLRGTMTPSDSRCAPDAFAVGLYARSLPDGGGADGSLPFPGELSARAAPHTPAGSDAPSVVPAPVVAFAVTCSARLPHCSSVEAAGFT